jgi:hypothetical protein
MRVEVPQNPEKQGSEAASRSKKPKKVGKNSVARRFLPFFSAFWPVSGLLFCLNCF